jgi:hypothetical protein
VFVADMNGGYDPIVHDGGSSAIRIVFCRSAALACPEWGIDGKKADCRSL